MAKSKDEKKEKATQVDEVLDEKLSAEADHPGGFVTQNDLNEFGKSLITTVSDLFKKEMEVHTEALGKGKVIPGYEIGSDTRGIDPVAAHDLIPQAELEDFMEQELEIYVHPSPNREDLPVPVPNVNGINQPIIRGMAIMIKRKYVEALARGRHTRYEQLIPDPTKPHKYLMKPDTVISNPFTVRHDPHPRGAEWLQGILAEG